MEKLMNLMFKIAALMVITVIIFMGGYIVIGGIPFFNEVSIISFLTGTQWNPVGELFGILPMLIASLLATTGSTIIGVFIGIITAVALVEIFPKRIAKVFSAAIDLLAGIPSVIYGFWGLMAIVPLLGKYFGGRGEGSSLLAAIIILSIMILPTIIRMTEVSLRAVPKEYKEGAYALGASKMQYIFKIQLKSAQSGIMAGIVLAVGRALGETMAVILVTGNAAIIPTRITDPVRTLTANVAIEMGYATGLHQRALFATGMVLFALVMGINLVFNYVIKRAKRKMMI